MGMYALLVGINYYSEPDATLAGCVNDTYLMRDILIGKGFGEEDITILNDEDEDLDLPTGRNVREGFEWLFADRESDDIVVFYFSGHGTIIPLSADEQDGYYIEALVLQDMDLLIQEDLIEYIAMLPESVQATVIVDSCHSTGLLPHSNLIVLADQDDDDVPAQEIPDIHKPLGHSHISPLKAVRDSAVPRSLPSIAIAHILSKKLGAPVEPVAGDLVRSLRILLDGDVGKIGLYGSGENISGNDRVDTSNYPPISLPENCGILLSGCEVDEISSDRQPEEGEPHGIFTFAVKEAYEEDPDMSYRDLILAVRAKLAEQGYFQNPQLSATHENSNLLFIC